MSDPQVDRMSLIERDDREAVRALRAEWDHAVPSAGGPSPYASWLEREVVRSRRQLAGAVTENARLRQGLRDFSIHAESCPRHRLFDECTCGLLDLFGGQ